MWAFKPGYLGVSIVILSILGGILAGSLLNVDTSTVSSTKYEYQTDITGLFETTQDPQYIDFNPASNYTGYTDATKLGYTTTAGASNYRIVSEYGTTSTGASVTIDDSVTLPQMTFYATDENGNKTEYTSIFGWLNDTDMLVPGKIANLYDWLGTYYTLADYQTITLNLSYSGAFIATTYNETITTPAYMIRPVLNITYPTSITVNIPDLTATYTYDGATVSASLYDMFICYGDSTEYDTTLYPPSGESVALSLSYTPTVSTANQYAYMAPGDGVYLESGGYSVTWDNDVSSTDYDNTKIDILIGPTFTDGVASLPTDSDYLKITIDRLGLFSYDYRVMFSYDSTNGWYAGADTEDLPSMSAVGKFPALMLSIYNDGDGVGQIEVKGVTSFTNYLNVDVSDYVIFSATSPNDRAFSLDSLEFKRGNDTSATGPLGFSVYNTTMFMDTYNTVLYNPVIDLSDYWPDLTSYRFAFQSFALYGDAVTINGVTYQITDECITIGEKSYKFDNLYLSYSLQGKTSITFNNINRTIDLGDTVDKTVSFTGNWYFSTGLYEGVESTDTVYNWDVNLFGDGLNTVILLALGLGALLALVCVLMRVRLKLTDKIVMAGGAVVLVLMLVV